MKKYKTKQRDKLIEYFQRDVHRSISAQDIYQDLNNDVAEEVISLSAIYRNLAEMEKEQLLCKVSKHGETRALYQYVHPSACSGVIHLKCEQCNETLHLDRNVSQMIFSMAEDQFQFLLNNSSAYLYGKCSLCAQKTVNLSS